MPPAEEEAVYDPVPAPPSDSETSNVEVDGAPEEEES